MIFYTNSISDDNVKGVSRSDVPTENYHLILQLPSDLQSFYSEFQLIV